MYILCEGIILNWMPRIYSQILLKEEWNVRLLNHIFINTFVLNMSYVEKKKNLRVIPYCWWFFKGQSGVYYWHKVKYILKFWYKRSQTRNWANLFYISSQQRNILTLASYVLTNKICKLYFCLMHILYKSWHPLGGPEFNVNNSIFSCCFLCKTNSTAKKKYMCVSGFPTLPTFLARP